MPSCKSDIMITIKAGEKSFTVGGVRLPDGSYKIKSGRAWSEKIPSATLTEIFTRTRKWAVKNL